ncbi:hypothetical protein NDR87_12305 [Nocardia sp. CDC159]|uniref:Uncharacterized protein n=1 Tax=Nocardia pulmonis TaxID=2951408 RepID=A0A9X2E7F8_9NOCA|nr:MULTISPECIES: hypothetical protein [Nocardia]MCM6774255.1 hypothetical protein [Nocardia pulmonis]MCM6787142.1 hypothetical protein [Nocardia sp. CDC159]
MTAGSGTPMWVRALRLVSLLLGIAALIRDELRALATTLILAARREANHLPHDGTREPRPGAIATSPRR